MVNILTSQHLSKPTGPKLLLYKLFVYIQELIGKCILYSIKKVEHLLLQI